MAGQDRTNQYLKEARSVSRAGQRVIPFYDDCIFGGCGYSVETIFSVTNGESFNIVFDPSGIDSDKRLTVFPTAWNVSTDIITVNLGICASYTGGTEISYTNRNYYYASSKPGQSVLKRGATLTDFVAGNTNIQVGTESGFLNPGGGSASGGGITILDKSLIYVFSFTAPAALTLGVFIRWFESPINEEFGY
jgi:hypothetical protein